MRKHNPANGTLTTQNVAETTLTEFASNSLELYNNLIGTTYLFAYLMDEKNKEYYEDISVRPE
ncbi:MAG: hypothetical protein ACYC8S_03720 [Minisyncoccota bacterium]